MVQAPPSSTLFPYTTLFRSIGMVPFRHVEEVLGDLRGEAAGGRDDLGLLDGTPRRVEVLVDLALRDLGQDRKSTRLNSSHSQISYAVFCLKKKIPINNFRAP